MRPLLSLPTLFTLILHHLESMAAGQIRLVCNADGCSLSHLFTFSVQITSFSFSYLFSDLHCPYGDRPEHAGITTQQLNSLRPLNLSAQCDGTCSGTCSLGRGSLAVLLWRHALLTSKSLHTQGISLCYAGKKIFLGFCLHIFFQRFIFQFFPEGHGKKLSSKSSQFYLQSGKS